MSGFLVIRTRWVLKILKKLVSGKASGPDNLPVRIFKECAAELATAIAVLVRFLLRKRHWPEIWRLHRIHPLFKKGSVSAATNYRGVHLTNVLSKVVERVIAHHLTPFFDRTGAYGMDQWAFRKKRSCRDLVTLLVCRWIWALDNGFKVAIYLSDISGAFDRVDREILVERLRRTGLTEEMIEFLYNYLAPRHDTSFQRFFDLSGRATSRTPWGQCILLVTFCAISLYIGLCVCVCRRMCSVSALAVWSSCVVVCPSPSVVSSGVDLAC